jgi:hypothetical protein
MDSLEKCQESVKHRGSAVQSHSTAFPQRQTDAARVILLEVYSGRKKSMQLFLEEKLPKGVFATE